MNIKILFLFAFILVFNSKLSFAICYYKSGDSPKSFYDAPQENDTYQEAKDLIKSNKLIEAKDKLQFIQNNIQQYAAIEYEIGVINAILAKNKTSKSEIDELNRQALINFKKAIEIAEKNQKESPWFFEAYLNSYIISKELNMNEDAANYLKKSEEAMNKQKRTSKRVFFNIGKYNWDKGNQEEAVKYYDKVIMLDPTDAASADASSSFKENTNQLDALKALSGASNNITIFFKLKNMISNSNKNDIDSLNAFILNRVKSEQCSYDDTTLGLINQVFGASETALSYFNKSNSNASKIGILDIYLNNKGKCTEAININKEFNLMSKIPEKNKKEFQDRLDLCPK